MVSTLVYQTSLTVIILVIKSFVPVLQNRPIRTLCLFDIRFCLDAFSSINAQLVLCFNVIKVCKIVLAKNTTEMPFTECYKRINENKMDQAKIYS